MNAIFKRKACFRWKVPQCGLVLRNGCGSTVELNVCYGVCIGCTCYVDDCCRTSWDVDVNDTGKLTTCYGKIVDCRGSSTQIDASRNNRNVSIRCGTCPCGRVAYRSAPSRCKICAAFYCRWATLWIGV